MATLAIVEQLDVIKQRGAGLIAILKGVMERPLVLQGAEEALDDRIVVTVTLPTHARHEADRLQPRPVDPAGVLKWFRVRGHVACRHTQDHEI